MAVFSKLVTTEKGRELMAKVLANQQTIVFTQVALSNVEYATDELETLETIDGIKQIGSISKVSKFENSTVKIETVITNTTLTEGYYIKTVALYAQDEENEIVYAIANETSGICYMPPFEGVTVSGAYLTLSTTISNAANVTVDVDNAVYATIGNIKDLQEQINSLTELLVGNISNTNVHSKNLSLLNQMGFEVYHQEIKASVKCSGGTTLFQVDKSAFTEGAWSDKTYYLYHLYGALNTYDYVDSVDTYEGQVLVGLNVYSIGGLWNSWFPIVPTQCNGALSVNAIDLWGIYGPPLQSGIQINIQPMLYKKDSQGQVSLVDGTKWTALNMHLRVYKLGSILQSTPSNSDTGGSSGGVNDYAQLLNKPSINNVTLIGNLTSAQLGLENSSSGGGETEMTYDETLAELNGEETT